MNAKMYGFLAFLRPTKGAGLQTKNLIGAITCKKCDSNYKKCFVNELVAFVNDFVLREYDSRGRWAATTKNRRQSTHTEYYNTPCIFSNYLVSIGN